MLGHETRLRLRRSSYLPSRSLPRGYIRAGPRPAAESARGTCDPAAVGQPVGSACRVGPRSVPVGQSNQSRHDTAEGLRRICTAM